MKTIFFSYALIFFCVALSAQKEPAETKTKLYMDDSSTIEMGRKGYQFLMSSQNYGTNYAIYVKLKTDPVRGKPNQRELKWAKFKLLNYKANVFLSIEKVSMEKVNFDNLRIEDLRSRNPNLSVSDFESYKIKVYVKAKPYDEDDIKLYEPEEQIILNKHKLLISERYLLPMFSEIVSEATYKELEELNQFDSYKGELGYFRIKPHNFFVVDTEFFYMDGTEFIRRKLNYDAAAIDSPIEVKKDDALLIPGPRCKTGFSVIL